MSIQKTKFAPATRVSDIEIKRQIKLLINMPTLNILLSKIPSIFLILNKQRQIIYMNQGALNSSGLQDFTSIIGQRPGEMFGCINSP